MDSNNKYTKMQKDQYRGGTSNHQEHNSNNDYWNILLNDIKNNDGWNGKVALDFGCGKGRNVTNMLSLAEWSRVDGVDISEGNIEYCSKEYKEQNSDWYVNSGTDLKDLNKDEYDFVMSTITLQHIPVYDIRQNILKEILRVMKPGAVFSFQMTYGPVPKAGTKPASYHDNMYEATSTNSGWDVRISDENDVVEDLHQIGFVNVTTNVRQSFSDDQHPKWIYIRCEKPKK